MWTYKDYCAMEGKYATRWADAMAWAQKMNDAGYGGYSDWTVPTISQYRTINNSKTDRDVYALVFGKTNCNTFWSSNTPGQFVASYMYFGGAEAGAAIAGAKEGINFSSGETAPMSVRLVRSGASVRKDSAN
jgi:hypothetical protein